MARPRLAASKKNALKQRAHIVWLDESGLLLLPLVRRTYAPCGCTPVLRHRAKHRQKVSLIAAFTISPRRHRFGLYYQTLPNHWVNNVRAVEFVRQLLRHLRGRVIVIWDGGNMHKGEPVRDLERRFRRLTIERMPSYAPELNPTEQVWEHLKYHELSNYTPDDLDELNNTAEEVLQRLQQNYQRLKSFYRASALASADAKRLI